LFSQIIERYFKIYFFLCLLVFTVAIFLATIPRLLADEIPAPSATAVLSSSGPEPNSHLINEPLRKLFHWNLNSAVSPGEAQETYMEFRGNRMLFKLRF
jgi:hypothetical protein